MPLLRFQYCTQQADVFHSEASRHSAPDAFVNQEQGSRSFHRQGDCLCLTLVELHSQCLHQEPIADRPRLDPVERRHINPAWVPGAEGGQFALDRSRDDDPQTKLRKQVEAANRSKIGQG